ncbi:Glutamine-dependent NAD(+) synthetase [Planctomycetes bacterium Poly30]|uniref:Glutamine-dependent NAD(+) synthetase n=1 Tax=Saltatorellus ferox TaxID=2528018 RepID=A0A518ENP9_9BACT|nr:Glutamine-dependent NAD(+) synthetase [Planctomycetes bacterium Poly30]
MDRIHFATAAVNQTPLDWSGNLDRCKRAIAEARRRGATVVLLPELALPGYGCEDAFHAAHIEHRSWESLSALCSDVTAGMVVGVGLPVLHRGALYNCAALIADGKLVGIAAKQHLAGDGIHYEPRWFRPWPPQKSVMISARDLPTFDGAKKIPMGELVFDIGGYRFGFEICEDAWVSDRPGARLAALAVDAILNPSASHFAFGKRARRERLVCDASRSLHAVYVYSNLVGNEAGRALYDGACFIAVDGNLEAVTPRFSFDDVCLTDASIDLEVVRRGYRRTVSAPSTVEDPEGMLVAVPFDWPEAKPPVPAKPLPEWERGMDSVLAFEEFTRAEAIALFDYMRKAHSRGYVVSLSGGADSATCAALVALMVQLGTAELGVERFAERLRIDASKPLVEQLLICAYQPTENSGDVTRHAAATVAEALGARYHVVDVQPMLTAYRAAIEAALGRELTWERDDITLQNLQARVRSPSIWALANEHNSILMATSNRSEAAVGYTTMDGDSSGGLAPISGVDKSFVLAWLRWMEKTGPSGIGPFPSMSVITAQQPTAELRPKSASQRDEDDLMPYPVLDAIEELYIRDRLAPQAVLDALGGRFPEFDREDLKGWVRRFYGLWVRNQWKRERIAPSFHLDDENLDPKTWCRYPILGGNWGDELAALS